jgi:hypothetical protein
LQARSNGEEQRDGAAASAHSNGRQPYAALQQWQVARIFYFIFFYSTVSREQEREKRHSFETCFSTLVVGLTQAASCNVDSFRQQQHQHPSAATTPVALAVATIT